MSTPFDAATPHAQGYRDITPKATLEAVGQARLVDVRRPDEFTGELGHVAGSALVTLGTVPQTAEAEGWAKDEDIILICRSGNRSGTAASELVAKGFTRVMNMVGGMLRWNDEKLPVER